MSSKWGRTASACIGVGVLIVVLSATVRAGYTQGASLLDKAEQLADSGDALEARQVLQRWERELAGGASAEDQARAWFLAARLAEDAEVAEVNYLRVVIEGSTSRYADDALLLLGQYKYALGDYAKVIDYLGRLRRDYPTSEHAATALLWIARAARSRGDSERACSAAEQGLREVAPLDTLLEHAMAETRAGCRDASGNYTVQVAALKDESAAQRLARDLLSAGYDAWVLNATPRDPFNRVRVGRDLLEAEAQALLERLVRDGHSPFLVAGSSLRGGDGR